MNARCKLAAIFLLGFANTSVAAEAPPQQCRLTLFSALDIETLPDGRIGVPVAMEKHPMLFLVDTGGAVATVNYDKVAVLGKSVKNSPRQLIGVGGTVMSSYVTADSFLLGRLSGSDLALYVESRPLEGVDGTLAPDMLKRLDVDIDFANSKLNLFSQEHCPGKVVYWTNGGYVALPMMVSDISGHIRVPVTIDGKKIMATIDTGASTSIMSLSAAKAIGISEGDPQLKSNPSSGFYRSYSYPFRTLDFDGVTVTNPRVVIASDDFLKGLGDDLIIGIGILRQLHLYIAYKEEKLYITPALAN